MYFRLFKIITGFDLLAFIERFRFFHQEDLPLLRAYYLDSNALLPRESFQRYFSLLDDVSTAIQCFQTFRSQLVLEVFFDFLIRVEEARSYLRNIPSIPRIYRLSRPSISNKYLIVNKSLERFSEEVLGNREAWVDLAVRNNTFETDYLSEINITKERRSYTFTSVYDTIDTESVLGKDIGASFNIGNDDIVVLSNKETFLQSARILGGLVRGGNPYLSNLGIDKSLLSAGSLPSVFNTIGRQFRESFTTDDSIASVTLTDLRLEENALYLDYEVMGINNQLQRESVNIR